jgi:Holliday junction resolvase
MDELLLQDNGKMRSFNQKGRTIIRFFCSGSKNQIPTSSDVIAYGFHVMICFNCCSVS